MDQETEKIDHEFKMVQKQYWLRARHVMFNPTCGTESANQVNERLTWFSARPFLLIACIYGANSITFLLIIKMTQICLQFAEVKELLIH